MHGNGLQLMAACAGFAACATTALSQDIRSDYERAANAPRQAAGKVYKAAVIPHWIADSSQFWYMNSLPGGIKEFWLCDPKKPSRQHAFDYVRMAAALSTALKNQESPTSLPITDLTFEPGHHTLIVTVPAQRFTVDLNTYELSDAPAVTTAPAPRRGRSGAPTLGGSQENTDRGSPLSPDKKWRAVLVGHNLAVRNTSTNVDSALTTDGSADDSYDAPVWWSPDSRRLVVYKTVSAQEHKIFEVESSPADQEQPKLHTLDYLKPGDRIAHPRPHLFDVETLKEIPVNDNLFPNPWEMTDLHWSQDSSRFSFLYNQRGHQTMRLISVDAATGASTTLIDEQTSTFIDWTAHVYLHRMDKTNEAIWMSERDGWNHLYLYDTSTRTVKNQITRGNWVVRGVDYVDDARRQIWFRAGGIVPGQDPYFIQYCCVNFDGTGLTVLTKGDGTHTAFYSPDRSCLVDTWSRVDTVPVTKLRDGATGAVLMPLEEADASALLASGFRFPDTFTAKGRDGVTDIYGIIYTPTHMNHAQKYPVIEVIYAGPQDSFVPKSFAPIHGWQFLTELGFIVVQIDGMGTSNRSRAFHDVCFKNLADAGFPDRVLWIKAAAAKFGNMDLSRVGIYGTSAGGQSALGGLLTHGDFYKVGVSDSGCHDNRMDKIWWNEQWMSWPIGPWYEAQSNVTLAHNLTGKLLLMFGELDTNVDPSSTLQVANALIKAGKTFDLVEVPGAGHGVAYTPFGRRKLEDFFVRNLLHKEPPDWNAGDSKTDVAAGNS